jgi:radical SAM enzyme (TIGR01210 family)
MDHKTIEEQIRQGSVKGGKRYTFNDDHDPTKPASFWFQQSHDGLVLFVVFYTQACRWSRCLGCNLPAAMASMHVSFQMIMAQIDYLFDHPEVSSRRKEIRKVIISNNGSVLDEATFPSTALMYLVAKLNITIPYLDVLSIETRPEYTNFAELAFLSQALKEGQTPTRLELAIGFEAFDDRIRNEVIDKGLTFDMFEKFVRTMSPYGYQLKTYFMQKPVPDMSDEEAIEDIHKAIDYLSAMSTSYHVTINMHLNPTYAAKGTLLETAFRDRLFIPPYLQDVARAALHAKGKSLSVFIGLSDEGLAVQGGSFIRNGDEDIIDKLEQFNRTQDFSILGDIVGI